MCSSICITVFALGIALGAGLTIVSLATPAWRKVAADNNNNYYGIFTSCVSSNLNDNQCYAQWQTAPDWKKASMGCLVASLACCAMAFMWSCIACCMCCCKSCLTPPLPIFAGLACILDIIGVTLYGVKSGQTLGTMPITVQSWQDLEGKGDFGYSMWIGIAAIGVLFVDTVIGVIIIKASKVSPL